jgi:hypothetical protein
MPPLLRGDNFSEGNIKTTAPSTMLDKDQGKVDCSYLPLDSSKHTAELIMNWFSFQFSFEKQPTELRYPSSYPGIKE